MSEAIPTSCIDRSRVVDMLRSFELLSGHAVALATVGVSVVICKIMEQLGVPLPNVYMVFLLGVVFVSSRHGAQYGILAAILSVASLAFFFMSPIWSLAVADVEQVLALAVLFTIGVVVSGLTAQIRSQARDAERNATRLDSLYRLSRELADLAGRDQLAAAAVAHSAMTFGGRSAVFLDDGGGALQLVPPNSNERPATPQETEAIRSCYANAAPAGSGTDRFADLRILCLPLVESGRPMGVFAYWLPSSSSTLGDEQYQLLAACVHQVGGALERDRLSTKMRAVRDEVENERLRSALLSSLSHDLRTPLAAVVGASSSLIEDQELLDGATRESLHHTIFDNSNRLARLVDNLLSMTQLETGFVKAQKQWHVLEEVVGTSLRSMSDLLVDRRIETNIPADLPLVPIDAVLMQQVFLNLFDNALKYDVSGKPIEVTAYQAGTEVVVEVADRGIGLSPGQEMKVFEKFFRGANVKSGFKGSGLGLTICQAIVAVHDGRIVAENRRDGGAVFRIALPCARDGDSPPPTSD